MELYLFCSCHFATQRSIRELRKQLAELDSRRLEEAAQLNQKCRQMAASVDDAERARASAAALVQSVQDEASKQVIDNVNFFHFALGR